MGLMGSPWDGTSRYVRASNISLSWSDWEQYDVGTLKPWCGEITCSIIIIIIIIIILLKCSKNTPICSDSKTMYQQPIPITHCLFPKKHTPPPGKKKQKKQGTLYHQPKQCTITREIPQNYQTFAACVIPPKMGPFRTDHPHPLALPPPAPRHHHKERWDQTNRAVVKDFNILRSQPQGCKLAIKIPWWKHSN